jgi:hypothetical protein
MKEHFCCFGNTLERVIQEEGRKQLGIDFGTGGSPNCRGLTIEEITGYDKHGNKVGNGLDFSKMDFSDFVNELMVKFTGTYKTPNPEEIAETIKNHMNIKEYDGDENNPDNRFAGLNKNIKDDSWEAEEERRIEQERLAKLEQERLEAERSEQKRLAEIERLKLEEKRKSLQYRKSVVDQNILALGKEYGEASLKAHEFLTRHGGAGSSGRTDPELFLHHSWGNEYLRLVRYAQSVNVKYQQLHVESGQLQQQLRSGAY